MADRPRIESTDPAARADATARARAGWGDAPRRLGLVYLAAVLFFIAYAVWALTNSHLSPPQFGLGLGGVALFVLIAAPGFRAGRTDRGRSGGLVLAEVVGLAAIAGILTLVAPVGGAVSLFFFAGIAACFVRPDERAVGLIGVVVVLGGLTMSVVNGIDWGIPLALEVGLISITTYGVGALRRTNRELLEARSELARMAVAEERGRIARDLHDTLGHSLSLITLKSELAGRLLPADPVRARAEIGDVEQVARDALASVRETVGGYRQTTLAGELDGVTGALRSAGIKAHLETVVEGLAPAADTLLAWT
ncbi:MAG: sensor histidine kinase, partial [Candidatus Limnocylindrales bacterium]